MEETTHNLSEPAAPVIAPEIQKVSKKNDTKRKWLIIGGFLIVILIVLSYFMLQKPKQQQQPVAMIGDHPVYLEDLQKVASEQYLPTAIDEEALNTALDTLSERYILDQEAKRLSITVSDEEVRKKLSQGYTQGETIPESIKISMHYELLKDKITKEAVASRQAYTIDFYIASYDEEKEGGFSEEEKVLFAKQRAEGAQALPEIEGRLKVGESPVTIARSIYKKYPSLQPILSVNGYILRSTTDESILAEPKIYEEEPENQSLPLFHDISMMHQNEIKRVISADGSGGYVIQVKGVTEGATKTYEDWLKEKKNS
jgi:hypothetical protein